MKKTYIAPETELIVSYLDHILRENSNPQASGTGENGQTGGEGGPSGGGSGTGGEGGEDFGARQHNNWMWDTMEDEF